MTFEDVVLFFIYLQGFLLIAALGCVAEIGVTWLMEKKRGASRRYAKVMLRLYGTPVYTHQAKRIRVKQSIGD